METPRLTPPRRPSPCQCGFSMIELLIAAFILSIGLLGLLSLQLAATAQSGNSRERGTAVLLAHNLLDRIAAEGALSAGERMDSSTGTVTSSGFTYIDPALTEKLDGSNLFFDIGGIPVITTAPNKIFTVSWIRKQGSLAGPYNASAEFIVNVQWDESASKANVKQTRYFSVSRNVRL